MSNSRQTIGVLIPVMDQYYQTDLWQGILNQSDMLDYNVLFFCGSVLDAPLRNDKQSNIIYNLPNMAMIDGIISTSGTLSNYSDVDYFEKFIKQFTSVPIVHLSYDLNNVNTINIDNYQGMKKLIEHLITEHDFNNYVFISGPSTNYESQYRLQAFLDCMETYQIPHNNYITFEGDFSKESSEALLRKMYKDHIFSPDIIICANDEMAIGTNNILEEMNISAPDDVAFTGFDNIPNSTTFTPSFTTISQPIHEMGAASVKGIHDLLNKKKDTVNLSFGGELILRESCGCYNHKTFNKAPLHHKNMTSVPSITDTLNEIKDHHLHYYLESNHISLSHESIPTINKMFEVLINELNTKLPTGSFMKYFYKFLKTELLNMQLFNWTDFVQWLKENIYAISTGPIPKELHDIFYHTSMYANKLSLRKFRKENYDFMEMYYYSSELIVELTKVSTIEEMFQVIAPYIKAYDFSAYYVCLFKEPIEVSDVTTFEYPEEISMSFGYENGQLVAPYKFTTTKMLPPHIVESNTSMNYIFYPIFFGSTHFGYHICKPDIALKSIFRTIKEQIVNSLNRLKALQQLEDYNKQLQHISNYDPLTNVLNRRGIHDQFQHLIGSSKGGKLGIIYGDIDNLKPINDLYGHHEGDFAIKSIASILTNSLSGNDILGRYGGDEFICVILNPNETEYEEQFMDTVQLLLKQHNSKEYKPYKLDISFGFSILDISDDLNIDAIFMESDHNLYKVKQLKKLKSSTV